MSTPEAGTPPLRIGDVARLVGTTPRTIRYYEEKGLLPPVEGRPAGQHRLYDEEDVARLRGLLRLRNLLDVPLDELRELVAVDDERELLRSEFRRTDAPAERARILRRLDALAERQLALVDLRARELDALRDEIEARRARIAELLSAPAQAPGSAPQQEQPAPPPQPTRT